MKKWKQMLTVMLALVMTLSMAACGNQNAEETTKAAENTATQTSAAETDASTGQTEAATEVEKEWFGTEDGKTITLRFWGGVQPEYGYDDMVTNFNAEYADKGLQIEYVRYVNNTDGNLQLQTYLMSGGEVDVFMSYGGRTQLDTLSESNLICDMSDMLETYGFDLEKELGAASMANFLYDDGSVYGFPTKYENNNWLMINVDMFEAAGIEIPYDGWTYSEFLTAVEKLTYGEGQDKVYGILWRNNACSAVKTIIGSVLGGERNFSGDGSSVSYDNEIYKLGFELVNTTVQNGWAFSLEDEVSEGLSVANTFLEGECAMTTNIADIRLAMDTVTYPREFVTAVVPAPVPDGEEYNTEYYRTHAGFAGAGDVICIANKTEYKEACFEFVMWYVQGGMATLAKGGRIPLWTGLDKSLVIDVVTAKAEGAIDMDSLNNYLSIDNTKGVSAVTNSAVDSEVGSVFKEEFHAMLYGTQTVDEALNNIVTRCNELIANAK